MLNAYSFNQCKWQLRIFKSTAAVQRCSNLDMDFNFWGQVMSIFGHFLKEADFILKTDRKIALRK